MDILQEIVAHKRIEVERFKQQLSEQEIHRRVEAILDFNVPSMSKALTASESGIIAEFKRRSPSKGWIKEEGKADEIPLSYQEHGAAALSILTDEQYFGGKDDFIRIARHAGVHIPILYKNFIIDEYQLFQARLCGASAVLLIAADLSKEECRSLCLPPMDWAWKSCWRCTARKNWSMRKWSRTCAASTTVTSEHSSPMFKTVSDWQNYSLRTVSRSVRAVSLIPIR